MKDHLILKDFRGSQDGFGDGDLFLAGSVRPISDSLLKSLGGTEGGYVREADIAAEEIAKAPPVLADAVREAIAEAELQPRELAEGEMLEEGEIPEGGTAEAGEPVNPADLRETKVVEPKEKKPAKAAAKKAKP